MIERIHGYCALCRSRCGCVCVVEDGRLSQHRGLPALRRLVRDPQIEIHPAAAATRDIIDGDWVVVETPDGRVRARARFNESLDPRVVCGQHGWWQGCGALGAPAYEPFSPDGANYNLLIGNAASDPISGSVPHRAYLCEIVRDIDIGGSRAGPPSPPRSERPGGPGALLDTAPGDRL